MLGNALFHRCIEHALRASHLGLAGTALSCIVSDSHYLLFGRSFHAKRHAIDRALHPNPGGARAVVHDRLGREAPPGPRAGAALGAGVHRAGDGPKGAQRQGRLAGSVGLEP